MTIKRIDPLINDQEINLLADLFLSDYGFDTSSREYRRIKNAVILLSHGVWKPKEVYSLIAECEGVSKTVVSRSISKTIYGLQDPIDVTFNEKYGSPEDGINVTMSDDPSIGYILGFLGSVFLYIVLSHYNNYEYIKYEPEVEAK